MTCGFLGCWPSLLESRFGAWSSAFRVRAAPVRWAFLLLKLKFSYLRVLCASAVKSRIAPITEESQARVGVRRWLPAGGAGHRRRQGFLFPAATPPPRAECPGF